MLLAFCMFFYRFPVFSRIQLSLADKDYTIQKLIATPLVNCLLFSCSVGKEHLLFPLAKESKKSLVAEKLETKWKLIFKMVGFFSGDSKDGNEELFVDTLEGLIVR